MVVGRIGQFARSGDRIQRAYRCVSLHLEGAIKVGRFDRETRRRIDGDTIPPDDLNVLRKIRLEKLIPLRRHVGHRCHVPGRVYGPDREVCRWVGGNIVPPGDHHILRKIHIEHLVCFSELYRSRDCCFIPRGRLRYIFCCRSRKDGPGQGKKAEYRKKA